MWQKLKKLNYNWTQWINKLENCNLNLVAEMQMEKNIILDSMCMNY